MTTNPDWGTSLTYRDKTWGERPASFDSDTCEQFYILEQRFGNADGGISVELHERKRDVSPDLPPFIVFFNTTSHAYLVEVDRKQDLIDLLAHLTPIATAAILENLLGGHGNDLVWAALGDEDAKRRMADVKRQRQEDDRKLLERAAQRRADKAREKPPTAD